MQWLAPTSASLDRLRSIWMAKKKRFNAFTILFRVHYVEQWNPWNAGIIKSLARAAICLARGRRAFVRVRPDCALIILSHGKGSTKGTITRGLHILRVQICLVSVYIRNNMCIIKYIFSHHGDVGTVLDGQLLMLGIAPHSFRKLNFSISCLVLVVLIKITNSWPLRIIIMTLAWWNSTVTCYNTKFKRSSSRVQAENARTVRRAPTMSTPCSRRTRHSWNIHLVAGNSPFLIHMWRTRCNDHRNHWVPCSLYTTAIKYYTSVITNTWTGERQQHAERSWCWDLLIGGLVDEVALNSSSWG